MADAYHWTLDYIFSLKLKQINVLVDARNFRQQRQQEAIESVG